MTGTSIKPRNTEASQGVNDLVEFRGLSALLSDRDVKTANLFLGALAVIWTIQSLRVCATVEDKKPSQGGNPETAETSREG